MERMQSHIWLTASSYMGKYMRISLYSRKPFLINDFTTAPFWISFYIRKVLFYFLSVYPLRLLSHICLLPSALHPLPFTLFPLPSALNPLPSALYPLYFTLWCLLKEFYPLASALCLLNPVVSSPSVCHTHLSPKRKYGVQSQTENY